MSQTDTLHQADEIIGDRYRIIAPLGQGGMGVTYRAEDLNTAVPVALKTISLRRADAFKSIELFEREARVLAHLDHPKIPRYIDHFQIDSATNVEFYLAQQLAEGQPLSDSVEQGWQPTAADVRAIAKQVLDILVYLQALTPPVIHRDIKPQNIIRRRDGQIMLVDFGAVQDVYHNTVLGGSTVIGTYGYMAPEQFRGYAVLASDLYGLGTTLLFLLTRQAPSDLPQRGLKIDVKKAVAGLDCSTAFVGWLERMVEPVPEDRFHSATDALAVLQGGSESHVPSARQRPLRTPIALVRLDDQLVINIPPVWFRTVYVQWLIALPLAWQGISFILTWLIEAGIGISWALGNMPGVLLIPLIHQLVGLVLWSNFFRSTASRLRIECTPETIHFKQWILGKIVRDCQFRRTAPNTAIARQLWNAPSAGLPVPTQMAPDQKITRKKTLFSLRRDRPITVCELQGERFGFWLTEAEKAWITEEINGFSQEKTL
jgi:eukaryotic-like serine/threonine-protein kinase